MACIGKFFKKRGFNPSPVSSSIPKDKAIVVENPNVNTGRYIHRSEQVYTPIPDNYSNATNTLSQNEIEHQQIEDQQEQLEQHDLQENKTEEEVNIKEKIENEIHQNEEKQEEEENLNKVNQIEDKIEEKQQQSEEHQVEQLNQVEQQYNEAEKQNEQKLNEEQLNNHLTTNLIKKNLNEENAQNINNNNNIDITTNDIIDIIETTSSEHKILNRNTKEEQKEIELKKIEETNQFKNNEINSKELLQNKRICNERDEQKPKEEKSFALKKDKKLQNTQTNQKKDIKIETYNSESNFNRVEILNTKKAKLPAKKENKILNKIQIFENIKAATEAELAKTQSTIQLTNNNKNFNRKIYNPTIYSNNNRNHTTHILNNSNSILKSDPFLAASNNNIGKYSLELTNELRKQEIFLAKQKENKNREKQQYQQHQPYQTFSNDNIYSNSLQYANSTNNIKNSSKRNKNQYYQLNNHYPLQQQEQLLHLQQQNSLIFPDELSYKMQSNKHYQQDQQYLLKLQQQKQQLKYQHKKPIKAPAPLYSNTHHHHHHHHDNMIVNEDYEETRRNRHLPPYTGTPKYAPVYLEELKQRQKQHLQHQHQLLLNSYSRRTPQLIITPTNPTPTTKDYYSENNKSSSHSIYDISESDEDISNSIKIHSNHLKIPTTNTLPYATKITKNVEHLNRTEKKNKVKRIENHDIEQHQEREIYNNDKRYNNQKSHQQQQYNNRNNDKMDKNVIVHNLDTTFHTKKDIKIPLEHVNNNYYDENNSDDSDIIDDALIVNTDNKLKMQHKKIIDESHQNQKLHNNNIYNTDDTKDKSHKKKVVKGDINTKEINYENDRERDRNRKKNKGDSKHISKNHSKNNKNGRDSGVQVDEPDGQQQNNRNQQSGEGSSSISGGSNSTNRIHGSNGANSILNPEEPEKNIRKGLFFRRLDNNENRDSIEIPIYKKEDETRRLINRAIEKNEFLNNIMNYETKERVIDAMEPAYYEKGDFIIKENEEGSEIFVSESGEFQVIKNNEILTTLGVGIVFGELAILYNAKRFASIKATRKSKVWKINRTKFRTIMIDEGSEERKENLRFLKSAPFLKDLPDEILLKVCDLLKRKFFRTDKHIIRQGDKGDVFFIIRGGTVTIKKEENGKTRVVDRRKRGQYFGEQALLNSDTRLASVYADPPGTECLILDREAFINYLGTIEELRQKPIEREIPPEIKIPPSQFDFIRLEDLKTATCLGAGAFGVVNLVTYNDKFSFALKVVKKIDVVKQCQVDHIYNEKLVMSICRNSPFIVQLYNTFRDSRYVYFLMEVCLGGDVWTIMYQRKFFDEKTARFISGCVVEAFEFLHTRNIIYRDLKPENLMVTPDGYCKLVDFGFAKRLMTSTKTNTFAGTPEYVAPEIILDRGHDRAVDYWALGILIYELLAGRTPFRGTNQMRIYQQILIGIDAVKMSARITKSAQNIIKSLCKQTAAERLGYQRRGILDIKKHSWYDGFDWNRLRNRQMSSPINRPVKNYIDTQYFPTKFENDDDKPPEEFSGWDDEF